ncbi:MAG: Unknown protein [uncultured Campylobacterales bacterium]|uniref:Fibronectin type-III domain-containing protein n=1 Tax=uncultured Campylobacterales bacterium TaxID=352960 RepID=A0A6S6SYD0_9BACT|nr:MAG: Unknown protein [uncultured Campylobacterales bacterium]
MKYLKAQTLLIALIYSLFIGCAKNSLVLTRDITLPVPSNIKYISEPNKIAIEWKPNYNQKIDGYIIYKKNTQGEYSEYEMINSRFVSHYIDENLEYNTDYYYKFSTYNKHLQKESALSKVYKIKTATKLPSITFIKPILLPQNNIKIIFRPHKDRKVRGYIIKRTNDIKDLNWQKEFFVEDRLSAEFIDTNLKANTTYIYQLEAKTYDNQISYPSEIIKVTTHALPSMVRGIRSSTGLKDRINLYWRSNSSDEDISYYSIYQKSILGIKLLARTTNTKYSHTQLGLNKANKYYVTATSIHNLESLIQPKAITASTAKE